MNKIITVEELKNFVDIGKKPDVDKITPIILQAQDIDLRDHLGMKFYFDVMGNLENEKYQDLLSGSTFMLDGITYYHEGLKSMLADLFMSRYVMQINTNITPFGVTVKQSQDSEPADRNSLKDLAQMYKQSAGSKWEILKLYLTSNKSKFPIYNSSPDTTVTGERRLKFRKI